MAGVRLKEAFMGATGFGNSHWQQQQRHGSRPLEERYMPRAPVTGPGPLGVETPRITTSLTLSS